MKFGKIELVGVTTLCASNKGQPLGSDLENIKDEIDDGELTELLKAQSEEQLAFLRELGPTPYTSYH